jgi:hypothetical protein
MVSGHCSYLQKLSLTFAIGAGNPHDCRLNVLAKEYMGTGYRARFTGDGDVSGSFVANTITATGNAAFHWDESLADETVGNPYGMSKWREITSSTDRAVYSTLMSF